MKKFLFLLLVLYSGTAMAADWQYVGTAADRSILYLDTDSILRGEDTVHVWVKWDESPNHHKEIIHGLSAWETKGLYLYKCSSRERQVFSSVVYARDGHVLATDAQSENSYSYEPIVPDSMDEAVFNKVCLGKASQ